MVVPARLGPSPSFSSSLPPSLPAHSYGSMGVLMGRVSRRGCLPKEEEEKEEEEEPTYLPPFPFWNLMVHT